MGEWIKEDVISEFSETNRKVIDEFYKVIVGENICELLLISLYCGGHVLLEGFPGTGKTTIAKTFAKITGCSFKRIQFTPDLLPSDIVGTYIFHPPTGEFKLRKGPIFANIVLADEINRGLPKTQSATLEAMQERQVTIEGDTYELPKPFMVIATQNPIEFEGVYPLPEAQIDRFLMKLDIGYPSKEEELKILEKNSSEYLLSVKEVLTPQKILEYVNTARGVYVEKSVREYIVDLLNNVRSNKSVEVGPSPRAGIFLLRASKVKALMDGRDYVIPDDIKYLSLPILRHRVILKTEVEIEGNKPEHIIEETLNSVKVP